MSESLEIFGNLRDSVIAVTVEPGVESRRGKAEERSTERWTRYAGRAWQGCRQSLAPRRTAKESRLDRKARPKPAQWTSQVSDGPTAGFAALSDYAKEALEQEGKRQTSFEQRGLAVVTTSGALVTLLFGLAALSTQAEQTFVLPENAEQPLIVALCLFVVAASAALVTNIPLPYRWADTQGVRDALDADPAWTEDQANIEATRSRLDMVDAAHKNNQIKGIALICAIALEVLAVTAVAIAIGIVIA